RAPHHHAPPPRHTPNPDAHQAVPPPPPPPGPRGPRRGRAGRGPRRPARIRGPRTPGRGAARVGSRPCDPAPPLPAAPPAHPPRGPALLRADRPEPAGDPRLLLLPGAVQHRAELLRVGLRRPRPRMGGPGELHRPLHRRELRP